MTHHPIKVLEDGTRVYSNHTRYKPMDPEDRVRTVRKPLAEGAFRIGGRWYLPLVLLPEQDRSLPETRPDTDAYDHMTKPRKCRCKVCKRPAARKWKAKWRKEQRQMCNASDSSTCLS